MEWESILRIKKVPSSRGHLKIITNCRESCISSQKEADGYMLGISKIISSMEKGDMLIGKEIFLQEFSIKENYQKVKYYLKMGINIKAK